MQGTPLRGHHADVQPLALLRQPTQSVDIGQAFKPQKLSTPLDRMHRKSAGKRSYTVTTRKRGRYTYARPAHGRYRDIALDATVRRAAWRQDAMGRQEIGGDASGQLEIQEDDLQQKVRVRKAANLILFAVDASWSMAAAERMEATKGAIMSLLIDAYQKRDQVCLVCFQRDQARCVLPPTSSVEMAKRALQDIPVGGKTPLSSGLLLSYEIIERERRRNSEVVPLFILLTDGAGNISMTGIPAREEALRIADLIGQKEIRTVVINTEHVSLDRGLAQELAERLVAPCYTLHTLRADRLYQTVRSELQS